MASAVDETVKAPAGRRPHAAARRTRAREKTAAAPTGVVAKALHILECVGLAGEMTLSELKEQTALPRSTLHRLVKLLVDERFLVRASPSHYRCTLKLWRIGALTADYDDVGARIQPVLRGLAETTGETAHYAVYEEGFSVYVAKADAPRPLRAGAQVGGRSPAHVSATGKAVLAWRDESEIRRVGTGAKRFTASSIAGADELSREAERVRRQGYAVSHGEWYEELWSVAAPIVDVRGNVSSAIGVAGPTERFKLNLRTYTDAVVRAAQTLSTGAHATQAGSSHRSAPPPNQEDEPRWPKTRRSSN
jgi:DNA-binding IclR family transcriptional regulator